MSAPTASPQRVRLFQNNWLERLTLISPRMFIAIWTLLLPLAVWAGWGSTGLLKGAGLFAIGLTIWSLFEYAMHRYLFHLEVDAPLLKWAIFLIHGNHHASPNDPLRGLMPLGVSVPVAGMVWGAFVLLCGAPGTWLFLGFIIGYVIYDTLHFACHHWPMTGKLGKALKRHHMRHHYVDDFGNFGISAIFWDVMFGTRIRSLKR